MGGGVDTNECNFWETRFWRGLKRDLAREECEVWSWECYLLFKMSDATTCLNTTSLDPWQKERLKLHRREGKAGGIKVPGDGGRGKIVSGKRRPTPSTVNRKEEGGDTGVFVDLVAGRYGSFALMDFFLYELWRKAILYLRRKKYFHCLKNCYF